MFIVNSCIRSLSRIEKGMLFVCYTAHYFCGFGRAGFALRAFYYMIEYLHTVSFVAGISGSERPK